MKLPTAYSAGPVFGTFTVTVADEATQRLEAASWLEAEHFLGSFKPVGHSFIQIIREDGQPVALLQWAACAYHLKDRDAHLGWDKLTCAKRRNLIVNNVRFLVREAARRPNLASKCLAAAIKTLPAQWQERFGYEPLFAETFTDPESHAGTCYKAAGWTALGLTDGHSRQRGEFYVPNERPKKLWIKPLREDARERLCAADLAPEHAAGETAGKGAPLPVTLKELRPLAAALRTVPDPRCHNRFHPLPAMLCCLCVGLLCGAANLNAILRAAAKLSQAQRRQLGLRRRAGSRLYSFPTYETFRTLLHDLDLDALGRVLSAWLGEHRGSLPAHLAIDAKTIRKNLGLIVTLCDIEQKVPVALAANPQQLPPDAGPEVKRTGELTTARKLLRSDEVNLLHATVSGDALYANDENARLIVQEKGGDYLFSLKDNQPTVFAYAQSQLQGTPFFVSPPESRNGEVIERQLAAEAVRSESAGFAHAQSVVRAERTVTHKKSGAEKPGVRFYISSLELTGKPAAGSGRASPPLLAKLIRGHWSVENNIHWLRDAVGDEDRCRSHDPNAACVLALLRTALLAPVRAAGHLSLTQSMENFAKNPRRALAILLNQRLA